MATTVTRNHLREAIRSLGLAEATVCAHSSLSSFGRVDGGAAAVVDAFLDEGCTLVVPTFTASFLLASPDAMRPERNGIDYDAPHDSPGRDRIYSPEGNEVAPTMGAIPAAVLARPERLRGDHPLCSFTALGPRADLVLEQRRWTSTHRCASSRRATGSCC